MRVEPLIPSEETLAKVREVSKKSAVDPRIVQAYMLRIPKTWTALEVMVGAGGAAFVRNGIQVLASVQNYPDGKPWIHVSACRRTGPRNFELLTYEELARVKRDFIGQHDWAYQVFAPEAEHVNDHPAVLHLFSPLDGKPALPDFTWGIGTI